MYKLITLLGPTASGKTSFAAALAARLNTEIISADSRQLYRGMTLGTGKDLDDYVVDGKSVPYHLIDIRDAGEKYNLFEYQRDFHRVFEEIVKRGKLPILCGGTGLYIESVLRGYSLPDIPANPALRSELQGKSEEELEAILRSYKALHNRTDLDSARRMIRAIEIEAGRALAAPGAKEYPAIDSLVIGIDISRGDRRSKISNRLRSRLDAGMVEEVEQLLASGIPPEDLIYYGLEYKYLTLYLIGELSYEEMYDRLEIAIHQFAKRQMTWFRGMERRGFVIHWIDADTPAETKVEIALSLLNARE